VTEEEAATLSWAHFICMATTLTMVSVEGAGGSYGMAPGLQGS